MTFIIYYHPLPNLMKRASESENLPDKKPRYNCKCKFRKWHFCKHYLENLRPEFSEIPASNNVLKILHNEVTDPSSRLSFLPADICYLLAGHLLVETRTINKNESIIHINNKPVYDSTVIKRVKCRSDIFGLKNGSHTLIRKYRPPLSVPTTDILYNFISQSREYPAYGVIYINGRRELWMNREHMYVRVKEHNGLEYVSNSNDNWATAYLKEYDGMDTDEILTAIFGGMYTYTLIQKNIH